MKTRRSALKFRGKRCLNCDHPLDPSDKYCPACGQLNSTKKLSFDDFFNEFFAGIFAYDSRFRRTLRALLFQPGKISKDYILGKRQRYANPFRFYLSASIIFFLIWGLTQTLNPNSGPAIQPGGISTEANRAALDSLRARTDRDSVSPLADDELGIVKLIEEQQRLGRQTYLDVFTDQSSLDTMSFLNASWKKLDIYHRFYKEKSIPNAYQALDSLKHEHSTYNHWLYKKSVDYIEIQKNPNIFVNYFISKLPFIIFFYLPVFALFIWLLYLRRNYTYMEHLVFTFHVQTTFFVLFTLYVLLNFFINAEDIAWIFILIFTFYLYKALRKFYGQGRVKTVLKFMILNLIFFILAGIAAVFSAVASFAIY